MRLQWLRTTILLFCTTQVAFAQDEPPPNVAGAPPRILLLVHQEFLPGKAGERRKLEIAMSRASEHLNVPNSWIDLESLTGPSEALSFDPFDSFEEIDGAAAAWPKIFAVHPEVAHTQEEINALIATQRTIIAARRDDLSYRAASIDLSKARFMRVLEVRLNPGHESEFAEAFKILSDAYEKIKADTPWVVYQVNLGMPTPTFLVFVPMRALKQNDDLLNWRRPLREAEGEESSQRMEQIAREAYASTESNLYAISPETSHVSKEFAEGGPEFWSPAPSAPKSAATKRKPAKP